MALPIERTFKASGLQYGEEIVTDLRLENNRPADKVTYLYDYPSGIVVDMQFGRQNPKHYRRTIEWKDIHSGAVKVRSADGELRARLVNPPEVIL